MNSVIWSGVGGHMERQIRIQEPIPPPIKGSHEEKIKPSRWWYFRRMRNQSPQNVDVEMAELKEPQPPNASTPNVHKTKETRDDT